MSDMMLSSGDESPKGMDVPSEPKFEDRIYEGLTVYKNGKSLTVVNSQEVMSFYEWRGAVESVSYLLRPTIISKEGATEVLPISDELRVAAEKALTNLMKVMLSKTEHVKFMSSRDY